MAQRVGLLWRQSCLQRQRMMHQREQRIATSKLRRGVGQGAQGEAIDDDRPPGGNVQQPCPRGHARRFAGKGKSIAEIDQLDLPARSPSSAMIRLSYA